MCPPFAWRSLVKVVTLISHIYSKPPLNPLQKGEWRIPDPRPQTHTWAVCPSLPASPQIGGSRLSEAPCLQQAWRWMCSAEAASRPDAQRLLAALPGAHDSSQSSAHTRPSAAFCLENPSGLLWAAMQHYNQKKICVLKGAWDIPEINRCPRLCLTFIIMVSGQRLIPFLLFSDRNHCHPNRANANLSQTLIMEKLFVNEHGHTFHRLWAGMRMPWCVRRLKPFHPGTGLSEEKHPVPLVQQAGRWLQREPGPLEA